MVRVFSLVFIRLFLILVAERVSCEVGALCAWQCIASCVDVDVGSLPALENKEVKLRASLGALSKSLHGW